MTRLRTTLMVLVAVGLVLLFGVIFRADSMPSSPLRATIVGRTNNAGSEPMVIVSVTNQSARGWSFYFAAEVGTPTGWTDRVGWVEKYQKGSCTWIKPHGVCQVAVPVPDNAARWRFRCASIVDASAFKRSCYRFVRQSGLARIGLPVQPQSGYSWTLPVEEKIGVIKSESVP